ncbi:hypothetical protein DY000_02041172 [Brassica cretica]|uniref:Uncharacterized protein n=1 Tax=Brassica cretica TaxID=69181 RepID=A0ABQ7BCG9_BRACR|nr:hypothetical protein DY000_02041172 [Brassica cretica]
MEAPSTSEERLGNYGKSLKDMETSINVGNNRLAAPGGINRQTPPLDCSAGKDSKSCSFLHASSFSSSVNSRPEMALKRLD